MTKVVLHFLHGPSILKTLEKETPLPEYIEFPVYREITFNTDVNALLPALEEVSRYWLDTTYLDPITGVAHAKYIYLGYARRGVDIHAKTAIAAEIMERDGAPEYTLHALLDEAIREVRAQSSNIDPGSIRITVTEDFDTNMYNARIDARILR